MTRTKNVKITEQPSPYDKLENMSIEELLLNINQEDRTVAEAVAVAIPQITVLIAKLVERFEQGGRLFYIGAGTSGRLGILDASEIPPTYGMEHGRVIGIIAGGDGAIRKAVEFAEDDQDQAWEDLKAYDINSLDTVVGIAASGTTKYVIGGIREARAQNILTACITNNPHSPLAQTADIPIEVIVGPEFITGSTRMKSGTSQKLVLNMITTTLMVRLGRVKGNKMVDMQLSNTKLIHRGIKMLEDELGVSKEEANHLLEKYGSVRKALQQNLRK